MYLPVRICCCASGDEEYATVELTQCVCSYEFHLMLFKSTLSHTFNDWY